MSHLGDSLPKRERHSRVPDSILLDKRLSHEAVRVYAGLSRHALKAGIVYIGQRRLADMIHMSQRTVARKLAELQSYGLITVAADTKGKRATYTLTSTVFLPADQVQPTAKSQWKGRRRKTETSKAADWANSRQALDEIMGEK